MKEHISLADKNLANIDGEKITAGNALLPDLVKGTSLFLLV